MDCDVAIIGGGPAGSTAGTLLRKYGPELKVAVFEREVFPRDHIGESQLPAISVILEEMGVWDKIEAANFPIKIGSTNRWGKNPELWDFEFYPSERFVDEARPAAYQGQRRYTAFQVDRSIYDEILLDHAGENGVEVRQGTTVKQVLKTGDRVDGLVLDSGDTVRAKYYVDASGHTGILRRAMGVDCDYPSTLKNVAFWDYWQNAEWAVEIGTGGTKIQVMSLGYGWIWFIPLGPTRTSIGLVVPADYYKHSGKRPEELYAQALREEERISALIANAKPEGKFATTKDWSFLSSRQCGDNWFLAGESAGFADPILSAGMTMAHAAGREVAFTILEMERGRRSVDWLRDQFGLRQSQRITSHIRFADFWYTANAQFSDIKDHVQKIARDAGLELSPDKAWQWLAQGGFIDEDLSTGTGGFSLFAIKGLGEYLSDLPAGSPFETCNVFHLDLAGASWKDRAHYEKGGVAPRQCYIREGKVLPISGPFEQVVNAVQRASALDDIMAQFMSFAESQQTEGDRKTAFMQYVQILEALITDGWAVGSRDPTKPCKRVTYIGRSLRPNRETILP